MLTYVATILWAVLIFWGSSIPGTAFPSAPDMTSVLVHFVEYSILGFLLALSVRKLKASADEPTNINAASKLFLIVLVIGFLYALSDEIHQTFVPGRNFEVLDLVVDAIGLIAGAAVGLKGLRLLNK